MNENDGDDICNLEDSDNADVSNVSDNLEDSNKLDK